MWAFVGPPTAIVSLCLPSVSTMIKRVRTHGYKGLFRLAKYDAKLESRSYHPRSRNDEGFVKLKGNSSIRQEDLHLEPLEHSARASRWNMRSPIALEEDGVMVRTEISVEEGRSPGYRNGKSRVG